MLRIHAYENTFVTIKNIGFTIFVKMCLNKIVNSQDNVWEANEKRLRETTTELCGRYMHICYFSATVVKHHEQRQLK